MEAAMHPRERSVRVLIADDEPLFVEMVEALLGRNDRIEVVGTARNGREAVELALSLAPDVTLMDISMPAVDGIEAVRRIRAQRPTACILTKEESSGQLVESILDLGRRA